MKRQTGVIAPELKNLPDLPFGAEYVWSWFCELSRARPHGFDGPLALRWEAVSAFFDLIGVRPLEWEIRAIIRLDTAYMSSRNGGAAGGVVTGAGQLRAVTRKGLQRG